MFSTIFILLVEVMLGNTAYEWISQRLFTGIARSEVQMGTGNEFLNFNLVKKRDPLYERSCEN